MTRRLLTRDAGLFAAWLHRWRWIGLILGCLSMVPLGYYQSGLRMNRSLASMFAHDDPVLRDHQVLQETFGGNVVVMLVYEDAQLMSREGLQRSQKWSEEVEQIEGVQGVLSVAKLADAFTYLRPSLPFGIGNFSSSEPALFRADDPVAQSFRDLFSGYTHGPDETTAAIVAMLEPSQVQTTLPNIRVLADQMPDSLDAMLVGEPVLLEDAFDLIQADGRRLAVGTLVLLSIVILVTLHDLRVVMLSALCIVWSTLATRCVMVSVGIEMSLVSTILVAIVAVIVVASVMHVGTFRKLRGWNTVDSIAVLAIPIACTCLTDAAGFMSLIISDVRPVTQFGVMTATAAICVLASMMLFSAALMGLSDRFAWKSSKIDVTQSGRFERRLRAVTTLSLQHRKSLGLSSIAVLIACFLFVLQLETNSSFLDNFRDESRIVQSYQRVENRLGGAGVWDVVLHAPKEISPRYLQQVRELETRLRELEVTIADGETARLSKVLSLADADEVASQVTMLSFAPPEVRLAGMRSAIPTFAQALLTFPDPSASTESRRLRIMLRSNERLSGPAKEKLMLAVAQTVAAFPTEFRSPQQDQNPPSTESPIVTGYSVLMSHLVASLVRDQWKALGVALVSVGMLIWIVTGRMRDTIAALIVNMLPILLVLSCLGLVGGRLDLGSAMIGAVSIGLSIDGSIHFLSGYHRRAATGQSNGDAAINTASDLAAPIALATVALVIGFGVLVTSPFVPTATFGLLVAATLAASSIANLTLLPAMIVWLSDPQTVTGFVGPGASRSEV